jgi:hypothetical protein
MDCQTDSYSEQDTEVGSLSVKENQKVLHEEIKKYFEDLEQD